MAEHNGKSFKITMYLVSVLVIVLISIITFIGKGVIANDEKSQIARNKLTDKIHLVEKENGKRFEVIMLTLKEITTEQRVVKELLVNGK